MLKQCENGHLYDEQQHKSCPFCTDTPKNNDNKDNKGFVKVDFPPPFIVSHETTPEAIPEETPPLMGMPVDSGIIEDFPVGWLVCINDINKVSRLEVYNGRNSIGKWNGDRLDIKWNPDNSISEGAIALIVYDSRNNKFFVVSSESKNDVYVNNQLLIAPVELKNGDFLQIGETKMVFWALLGLTHKAYNVESRYLNPGVVLSDKYIVGRVLKSDEFGTTYLAYSRKMDKLVVVKEYCPLGLADRKENEEKIFIVSEEKRSLFEKGAKNFFDEAKTISYFRGNRNIVSVYEFFYANDTVYYSMEYLEGSDLKGYIANKGGKLSEAEAIKIMKGICDALFTVHNTQTLHRNISPDSIFICTNGDIKLADFGDAKQVVKNANNIFFPVIVNPGLAPSEDYKRNGKFGPWTDIYSLGASVYYAVTGKMPADVINRLEDPELIFDNSLSLSPHFYKHYKKMYGIETGRSLSECYGIIKRIR